MMPSPFGDEEEVAKVPLKEALRILRTAVPKQTSLPVLRSIRMHSDGDTTTSMRSFPSSLGATLSLGSANRRKRCSWTLIPKTSTSKCH